MDGFRLQITVEGGEVVIRGDKAGLDYLIEACENVKGKTGEAAHWMLEPEMNNLTEGSLRAVIQYSDDDEDYAEDALDSFGQPPSQN